MVILLRVNKRGRLEEYLVQDSYLGSVKEVKPLSVVNAYLKELRERAHDDVEQFNHVAVYEALGLDTSKITEELKFSFIVKDLHLLFNEWILPKDRKTPLQRFKVPHDIAPNTAPMIRLFEGVQNKQDEPSYNVRISRAYATMRLLLRQSNSQPLPWFPTTNVTSTRTKFVGSENKDIETTNTMVSLPKRYEAVPAEGKALPGLLPLAFSEIAYCLENNIIMKPCKKCGNIYQPNNSHRVYCSNRCSTSARKEAQNKTAQV